MKNFKNCIKKAKILKERVKKDLKEVINIINEEEAKKQENILHLTLLKKGITGGKREGNTRKTDMKNISKNIIDIS